MPVLCMFYGIIVRMYREIGGKHNMPHIHAEYSGQEVVVALDGAGGKIAQKSDETSGCLDGNSQR